MNIHPAYLKVGKLFGDDRVFRIPKYQRNYAWQSEEIADLKGDLKRCLDIREATGGKESRAHFFGGLVTVRRHVTGSSRQELEVVDGQQRLATFVLLVSQLRRAMNTVADMFDNDDPDSKRAFLLKRIDMLRARFEWHQDSIGMEVIDIPRLQVSGPDNEFFTQLIGGLIPEVKRESHGFLKQAYGDLGTYLDELITALPPSEAARKLETVATVLEEDWTVLHMETTTQSEAYTLFQVLNDRGRGLTEGELMRAKTLELLDKAGTSTQRQEVESAWDEILAAQADRVDDCLRWIYASHSGKRPGKAQLYDDLMQQFFPASEKANQTTEDAISITATVKMLRTECQLATSLIKGEWPFETSALPVTAWERDRLRLLTVELEHTNCMPLLIAATRLDQKRFAEVVQLLEKFVFRYKLVVNAHIGPATSVYHKQALEIRKDPTKYKTHSLRDSLLKLIQAHASDSKFGMLFESLQYASSTNNRKIKYALLTLEHYAEWFSKGGVGIPTPDKLLIFDFPNTTIEHVYPLKSATPDKELQDVANAIGNLAILGPDQNDKAANKDFSEKKNLYASSCYSLTRSLAELPKWDSCAVTNRTNLLKSMALKVFSL